MFALYEDPWAAFETIRRRWRPKRVDMLVGYLGAGASSALQALRLNARIIVGLSAKRPALTASQLSELQRLMQTHEVKTLPGLHAKLYVFDKRAMAIGSANFTRSAFEKLDELLIVSDSGRCVAAAQDAFEKRWARARPINLSSIQVLPDSAANDANGVGGLGIAANRKSGFTTRGAASVSRATSKQAWIRLLASWPSRLETLANSEIRWSTSHTTKPGDLQLIAITKMGNGSDRLERDPSMDAVHSLWRARTPARRVRSKRWPIQADFDLVVRLKAAVSKRTLIRADLLPGGRWPQNPQSGKKYRGEALRRLTEVLAAANPSQAAAIRKAVAA